MATELPYFRFTVQEWQNGNISMERFELQGLFISICGFYWLQDCSLTKNLLQKKYKNNENDINELIDLGILKHEKRHDKIEIVFLNRQYDLLSEKRKHRQIAGSIGGNATAKAKQKDSYKDKDKDKDKDNNKDKDNSFVEKKFSTISYNSIKNEFMEFYKKKTSLDYYFEAKDGSAIKSIQKKLLFAISKKNGIQDDYDSDIILGFKHILLKIEDKWILEHLSLTIINSKLNEIISTIKSKDHSYSDIHSTVEEFYAKINQRKQPNN